MTYKIRLLTVFNSRFEEFYYHQISRLNPNAPTLSYEYVLTNIRISFPPERHTIYLNSSSCKANTRPVAMFYPHKYTCLCLAVIHVEFVLLFCIKQVFLRRLIICSISIFAVECVLFVYYSVQNKSFTTFDLCIALSLIATECVLFIYYAVNTYKKYKKTSVLFVYVYLKS